MYTSSQLFQDMKRIVKTYQKGVIPVDSQLESTAFFPGGYGLWLEDGQAVDSDLSNKHTMVVAPLFGSKNEWCATKENPGQNINKPWWRSARFVLTTAGASLDNVFFTNAYVGLWEKGNNKGNSNAQYLPTAGDYFEECKEFFIHQIKIQNPGLIVAVGRKTAFFLSSIGIGLEIWKKKSMKIIQDNYCEKIIYFGGKKIAVIAVQNSLSGIEKVKSVEMIRKYVQNNTI